ncbi:hypothetical protein PILCRDRAFT_121893 [Piloderma croceum F 1598]|uniref:Uncharacterized protein n=1 Tax=Piloderma croceum (strain F 1598) TaxID=765440 RepID=A0A0C3C0N8_PILCF|nr:hypothetical protein PILCRDRAFT_121893 [Piloderma croceum F 1598]
MTPIYGVVPEMMNSTTRKPEHLLSVKTIRRTCSEGQERAITTIPRGVVNWTRESRQGERRSLRAPARLYFCYRLRMTDPDLTNLPVRLFTERELRRL